MIPTRIERRSDVMDPMNPLPHDSTMPVFRRLLVNTLVTGVTSSFLWFALTFWVYLETRSVVATGVIGGAFSISSALIGPFFGTFTDRHRKHAAMTLSTTVSALCFAVAGIVFLAVDADHLLRLRSPWFWVLIGSTLLGSVAGQIRGIALSTCVTLLVPEDRRDRANGLVGTVTGQFPFFPRLAIDALPIPETDRSALWPIYDRYRDRFVALKADCAPGKPVLVEIEEITPAK